MLGIDPTIVLFGLGVGVLIGLTGIGGGSLMTPLLILFAGISPTIAIGTDLAYGAVTKTLGGWRHWRKGTVDHGVSFWLAVGSVPGSVIGVLLLEYVISAKPEMLLGLIAGVLLLVAVSVLVRAVLVRDAASRERHAVPMTGRTKTLATLIGLVLGVLLGLTSVGSGALIGFVLILIFRLTPHRVVGTDVFHASLMLWAATLAHLVAGNVDFGLMGTILIGSLPGVVIGTAMIDKVPSEVLRPALGCVLLAAGLGVAGKAGAELAPWMVLGIPAAAAVLIALANVMRRAPAPAQ
jgi:uncharacterized membrane protein YfcA